MILVTGATGFLGKQVCRRLEESGRPFNRTSLSLGTDLRDFDQTLTLFQAVRPKTVLNCACFSGGIQFGLKYPADVFRNNMPMIANLFEGAHRSGVERVVNPLANCVYPAQLTLFEESKFWDGPLHESVMVYGLLRKISWAGSWASAPCIGNTAHQASIVLRILLMGILALRQATLLNSARVCSNRMLDEARPPALFRVDPMVARETEDLAAGPFSAKSRPTSDQQGYPGASPFTNIDRHGW